MGTKVTINTYTVGDHFGTAAEIRSANTGRLLATTDARPLNFDRAALDDAEKIAAQRGYEIVIGDESEE